MASGTDLIKRAYRKIGADSRLKPATPEAIEDGRVELNSMVEEWLEHDIDIGFTPIKQASDETSIPVGAENAVVSNLAVRTSVFFDNGTVIVSPELSNQAANDFFRLADTYEKITIPLKVVSSTLPRGAGNTRGINPRIYKGKGSTVDG